MPVDIYFSDDIQITYTGDIEMIDSDEQHIMHILEAEKGKFYQYPEIGLGLRKYLNSTISTQVMQKEIKNALANDGYDVDKVEIKELNGERFIQLIFPE